MTFDAVVSHARMLTHDVRELRLTLVAPPSITFAPGQFVSFKVERPGLKVPLTRPYSIASPPAASDRVELVLNRVEDGPGSGYLFGLQVGDPTTFLGPAGSFVLRHSERDVLFVATGTGIAPIRSMLWQLAHEHSPRRVTLYWGLRHERDLYYQDELQELRTRLPDFTPVITLSRPSADWAGESGWVSRLVEQRVEDVSRLEVYLCGNGGMIRDVRQIVRGKGLCPIYTEQYYAEPRAS